MKKYRKRREARQKKGMKGKTMAISLAVVWTAVIIAIFAGIMPVSAQTENRSFQLTL